MRRIITIVYIAVLSLLVLPIQTLAATSFSLTAPSGTLTRGQDIQFTINIDTQGGTVTSSQIGLTYQTQYLQYVSTTPGETMSSVAAEDQGGGKIVLRGTNPPGYKGTGVFAYVNFKLIAQAPGSTELCALFAPSSATATPAPLASTTPIPTRLPKSGNEQAASWGMIFGVLFLGVASSAFAFARKR